MLSVLFIIIPLTQSAPQTVPMSAGNSALSEYMTPADARKEVELVGKQQVRCCNEVLCRNQVFSNLK